MRRNTDFIDRRCSHISPQLPAWNIELKPKILPSFSSPGSNPGCSIRAELLGTAPRDRINFQDREDGCDNFSGSLGWAELSFFNGLEHVGDTGGLRREGTLKDFSKEDA